MDPNKQKFAFHIAFFSSFSSGTAYVLKRMLNIISFTQINEIICDFSKFFSAITLRDFLEIHIISSYYEVK